MVYGFIFTCIVHAVGANYSLRLAQRIIYVLIWIDSYQSGAGMQEFLHAVVHVSTSTGRCVRPSHSQWAPSARPQCFTIICIYLLFHRFFGSDSFCLQLHVVSQCAINSQASPTRARIDASFLANKNSERRKAANSTRELVVILHQRLPSQPVCATPQSRPRFKLHPASFALHPHLPHFLFASHQHQPKASPLVCSVHPIHTYRSN
jgi:hypothetical protein